MYSEFHQGLSLRTDAKESRYIMDASKDFFEELLQYFEKTIFMQKTNDFLFDEFLSSGFHC